MRFEPPLDSVIVERELVHKSPEGITYPQPLVQWYGRIVAAGPGMLRTMQAVVRLIDPPGCDLDRFPMQYKVGDLVICPPGMPAFPEEIPVPKSGNTRLFVCSERQLLAKVIFEDGDKQPASNGKAG